MGRSVLLMYGAEGLPLMLDQLWFSITMRNTVWMAWPPLGVGGMAVAVAVGAVVGMLVVVAVAVLAGVAVGDVVGLLVAVGEGMLVAVGEGMLVAIGAAGGVLVAVEVDGTGDLVAVGAA